MSTASRGRASALLNIGEEDIKGHDIVQDAHRSSSASRLNYVGFVEGDDIFGGEVDVVVTDGFTGNVALKTMEGLARAHRRADARGILMQPAARLSALLARPVLSRVRDGSIRAATTARAWSD